MIFTASKVHSFGGALRSSGVEFTAPAKYAKFLIKTKRATAIAFPSTAPTPAVGAMTATTAPLTWSAGDQTPTDYRIYYKKTTDYQWTEFAHAPSAALTRTVTGLVTGTAYQFRLATENRQGLGPVGATATGTTP